MSIQQEIKNETVLAMKAKDRLKADVLKGLLAGFTNELVAQKKKPNEELPDPDALSVIKKGVKQRKDSIEQFAKGGRTDLVEKEKAELKILEGYLPAQMSEEEIEKIVDSKITELGITDMSDIGKLIGTIMKETAGNADGNVVKAIIEKKLK